MKLQVKSLPMLAVLVSLFFMVSCGNDDGTVAPPDNPDMEESEEEEEEEEPATETDSKTYTLGAVSNPDISGTARFVTFSNDSTVVELDLEGTVDGNMHPAHIHFNTAAEGGDIAIDLNPVDGSTGESSTHVTELNDDTAISYEELLEYDGYINVHFSMDDLGTLVAQGDIGQNELTGESVDYSLASVSDPDISGMANFAERVNGETLVSINLEGTTAGNMHPSHIHIGSVADAPGEIIVSLGEVDGETGSLVKNVTALNSADGTPNAGDTLDYTAMVAIDGYINVHLSMENPATLIAQGNVGSNAGEEDGEEDAINFDVTNTGVTAYIFNSDDLENIENPALTLQRGQTYTFTVDASGHPFYIKSVQGNGTDNAYDSGVTNNGSQDGTVTFEVPMDAPDTLYYNCQFHAVMTGEITITD
ncbi:MAG: hypothetical protein WA913_09710 [Pricia sp.]